MSTGKMSKENIICKGNALTGSLLFDMREIIGWGNSSIAQANRAVENSLYTVVAYDGDDPIGVGRMLGDAAYIWYIQDIIVIPPYQGIGVGKKIVTALMDHAKNNSLPGTKFTFVLLSFKGKDGFYEKLGFQARPNENEGPGMVLHYTVK